MEKIFLQFYREEYYLYGNEKIINFLNGLSHVWNQIKNEGQVIWRDVDDIESPPPIYNGKIYSSVWYTKSLQMLYSWAINYPNLKIFICGPIVSYYDLKLGKNLSNFNFIRGNAEDIFFNGITSDWNLEIPVMNKPIGYNVSLVNGSGCYWGKCNFCNINNPLKYRNINKIPVINDKNKKYIWIHVYSISPNLIKELYPKFEKREDVNYATYTRADKYTAEALEKTIPKLSIDPKYLGFNIGIEFPTNKMLKYMNKGTTVEEYLYFIKIAAEKNIRLHLNFILGWKPTDFEDVKNIELFLNKLLNISKPNTITAHIYTLYIVENKPIAKYYKKEELELFETDFDIYIGNPKLDTKQIEINNKIRKLYHSFPFMKIQDWFYY